MARARLAAVFPKGGKMKKRNQYEAEIKQERAQKRAIMYRKADIIARVEKAYGSTDLSDDNLFICICSALMRAGFDLHHVDEERIQQIESKKKEESKTKMSEKTQEAV